MAKRGRSKGDGHIYLRGKIFYLQYTVNGRRISQSLKTSDEKKAEAKASEICGLSSQIRTREMTVIKIAEARNIITKNRIAVADSWDEFLKSSSRPDSSPNTLKGYKCACGNFTRWIQKNYPSIKYVIQITEEVAAEYANYLWNDKKISERTFNAYVKALHLIIRILCKDTRNPFAKENITRKNEKQQGRNKFTEDQLVALLNIFSDPELKLINKDEMEVLFYIGALTGLRLADCCMLKWDNIHEQEGLIRCVPQKTARIKRMAVIPILQKLYEKLIIAKEWRENDYVMPRIADRYQRNPDGVRKDSIKILRHSKLETSEPIGDFQRKNNICRYGFHSFRHTYASVMASNGYSVNMLAKILGDDTKTLEKYYINIDDEVVRNTFNKLLLPESFNEESDSIEKIKEKIIKELDNLSNEEILELYKCLEIQRKKLS